MPANVVAALNRMRCHGLTLHCEHGRRRRSHHHRTVWFLSDGTILPDTLAGEIVAHPDIMPTNDMLPLGTELKPLRLSSQTYVLRKPLNK